MVDAFLNLFRPANHSDMLVLAFLLIPIATSLVFSILTWRNWRKVHRLDIVIERFNSVHNALDGFMDVMASYLPTTIATMTSSLEHVLSLNLSDSEYIGRVLDSIKDCTKDLSQIVIDNPSSQTRTDSKAEILYGDRPNPFKSLLFWTITLITVGATAASNLMLSPKMSLVVQVIMAVLGLLLLAVCYRKLGKTNSLRTRTEKYASLQVSLFNSRREFIYDSGQTLLKHQLKLIHDAQQLSSVPQARSLFSGLVTLGKLGNATALIHRISDMEQTAPLFAVSVALEKLVKQKYAPKAQEHHLTLVSVIDKGLAFQIKPGDFEQLMHALVANAITNTKPGGKVAIRGKRRGDKVIISITDTGVGISAETLPYLFSPLNKPPVQDEVASPQPSLGLQVCKLVTNRIGAELKIASKPGKGTVATLIAPRKRTEIQFDIPRHVSRSTSPLG